MNGTRHAELVIEGMTCAACVSRVSNALKKVPGVERAHVNLATERATLELHDPTDVEALIAAVERAGYGASVPLPTERAVDADAARRDREIRRKRRLLLFALILFVPTLALGMFVPPFASKDWVMLALTVPVWAVAGWEFHRGALAQARHGAANMDTLVSLGSTVALAYSVYATIAMRPTYYETASAIVTFIFIGKHLESVAKGQANSAIRSLLALRPQTARVRRFDRVITVPLDEVRTGDEVVVHAGERIAVDGIVIEGRSAIDRSMLTGESMPHDVEAGGDVNAGTLNGSGTIVVRATAVGSGTALSRIVEIVRQAQGSTPPVARLADRAASIFVPSILGVAIVTFLVWLTLGSWNHAVVTAVAVIVIACPCALGLATPTAIMVASGEAARRGVLFKDAGALERLAAVDTFVFDKTGTLTNGRPQVVSIEGDEHAVLRMAYALESSSSHPLALAVVAYAKSRGVDLDRARDIVESAGGGMRASIDGDEVIAGSAAFLTRHGVNVTAPDDGFTRIYVARAGAVLGAVALRDEARPSASGAIAALKLRRKELWVVSGDVAPAVDTIARELHIEHVVAQALPAQKAKVLEDLREAQRMVAFVGDGINDAPALAVSSVGIAMGNGTNIAMETAPVAILSSDLTSVVSAYDLSRATLRTIAQNVFWAFAYNVVLVPLAAFGVVTPIFAAAAMGASSLFVVGNSLLLKRR